MNSPGFVSDSRMLPVRSAKANPWLCRRSRVRELKKGAAMRNRLFGCWPERGSQVDDVLGLDAALRFNPHGSDDAPLATEAKRSGDRRGRILDDLGRP